MVFGMIIGAIILLAATMPILIEIIETVFIIGIEIISLFDNRPQKWEKEYPNEVNQMPVQSRIFL